MASSEYLCPPDMMNATVMCMPVPLHSIPLSQSYLLSPCRDLQSQIRTEWDDLAAECMHDMYKAFGSDCLSQLDFSDQSLESSQFETGATYATATWDSQANNWPAFQSRISQQPLPSPVNTFRGEAWSPPKTQAQPEFYSQARKRANQASTTKTSPDTKACTASSVRRQGPKRAKIGARGRLSPSSSNPRDDRIMDVEYKSGHRNYKEHSGEQSNSWHPGQRKGYSVKNRVAAKRCREKSKQYEQQLVDKEHEVTQKRIYLHTCLTALKDEVLSLKNQILQHGNCDCEMIQGYIAKAAGDFSVVVE